MAGRREIVPFFFFLLFWKARYDIDETNRKKNHFLKGERHPDIFYDAQLHNDRAHSYHDPKKLGTLGT